MSSTPTTAPAPSFTETLDEAIMEKHEEEVQAVDTMMWGNEVTNQVPPAEYKHDASKAPVLEEETFDFTIAPPDEE